MLRLKARLWIPVLLRAVRPLSLPYVGIPTLLSARPVLRAWQGPLRALGTVSNERSLEFLAPQVAAQWHPTKNGYVTPTDIMPQSN
jgi:hypothetical protein